MKKSFEYRHGISLDYSMFSRKSGIITVLIIGGITLFGLSQLPHISLASEFEKRVTKPFELLFDSQKSTSSIKSIFENNQNSSFIPQEPTSTPYEQEPTPTPLIFPSLTPTPIRYFQQPKPLPSPTPFPTWSFKSYEEVKREQDEWFKKVQEENRKKSEDSKKALEQFREESLRKFEEFKRQSQTQ